MSPNNPSHDMEWREELRDAIKDAVLPLVSEIRELRTDLGSLKLNAADRAQVYDRQVMDEKLNAIRLEVESTRAEIKGVKEFTWKVMGGIGTVLLILATFSPHISWH